MMAMQAAAHHCMTCSCPMVTQQRCGQQLQHNTQPSNGDMTAMQAAAQHAAVAAIQQQHR